MYRTADDLVSSIMLDSWPRQSAVIDFGLDHGEQKERYEAYYDPIRKGEITADQLHAVAGNGPKLTALLRGCKHCRHKDIKITTMWDNL